MNSMNLLAETQHILSQHGKTATDVLWVGNHIWWMSWNQYAQLSDQDYNNGFGIEEVDPSLMIIGDTWWLERAEYDGSEWWEYKTLPTQPNDPPNQPPTLFNHRRYPDDPVEHERLRRMNRDDQGSG